MLFDKHTYTTRREILRKQIGSGIILLMGNNESPINYQSNAYKYRQDSTFLYFFGLHRDSLAAVIDADTGEETLFGNDIDMDDIVWFGKVESVAEMARQSGIANSLPMSKLEEIITQAQKSGRTIHFLPPYRHDTKITLMELLGIHPNMQRESASLPLIKAVIEQRSVKSAEEIAELERACAIGYDMHTAAMRMAVNGNITEQEIYGHLYGIASARGCMTSFQSIVTMHGEIMHGFPSPKILEKGRLLLCDAGAETNENYCSDNTRTTPISGRFTQKQRDIYEIVEDCHDLAYSLAKPDVKWWDVHYAVCRLMTERLKALGLMKGNTDDALENGAHALFMPHGLGHMMGMDVHDMEGLGQTFVGFDEEVRPRLDQFGINCLRFGRRLREGFVVTDEPGIYFIPALIDEWKQKGINREYINFDLLENYKDFGGIRLEDDLLITAEGCRYLGEKIIPYHADDVEDFIN
ncbi:MAG: aminopeptidase P N-terminal domain-containing protein [Bacteroidaceae bacterium]|nr:aminopeptidase P N-terminal domain-containing protein [Bacteroidaceae bacterium]